MFPSVGIKGMTTRVNVGANALFLGRVDCQNHTADAFRAYLSVFRVQILPHSKLLSGDFFGGESITKKGPEGRFLKNHESNY